MKWEVKTELSPHLKAFKKQPSCACCMLGCKAAALMLAGVGCCALRLQQQQQQSWYSGATSQPFSLSLSCTHTYMLPLPLLCYLGNIFSAWK